MEIRAGDRVYELICSTSPEVGGVNDEDWAGTEDFEYLLDHLGKFQSFGMKYYEAIFRCGRTKDYGCEGAPYIWVNTTQGRVKRQVSGLALEWLDYKSPIKFWIKRVR